MTPHSGSAGSKLKYKHRKRIRGDAERTLGGEIETETPPIALRLRGIRIVRCSEEDRQLSMLDTLRLSVEGYLGEVDWWPLRPLERPQQVQHAKLEWEVSTRWAEDTQQFWAAKKSVQYGSEGMSIILSQSETDKFHSSQNRGLGENRAVNILPVVQPANDARASSKDTVDGPFWKTWIQYISQLSSTIKPNEPERTRPTRSKQMETYLCVDKCWTTIKDTRMRTVTAVDDMGSDFEFFHKARNLLNQAEGNWLQRKLTWRSYTSVTLSAFHFLFDNRDDVEVDDNPPPEDEDLFRGYHYTPIRGLSIDVQMRVCAKIMLKGIANPELGRGSRQLIDSMPKLLAPPGLDKKQFSGGWGFHARQGLCMRKAMGWIGGLLAFGIAFVPYWLCY